MNSFAKIVDLVCEKSPLQKKKIEKYLAKKEKSFFNEAEEFSINYTNYLKSQNIPWESAVDAYLKLCNDMVRSQIYFLKNDCYPIDKASDAYENVWNNEEAMKSYMIGLAISQYLWGTHYEIYSFFKNYISEISNKIDSYLEIGPGHGLFLNKALDYLDNKADVEALDISPISINITKSIINYFKPTRNVQYYNIDILDFNIDKKYDFIVICEVIEHLENPEILLTRIKNLLANQGRLFISTCVNCPAIDHVYHFRAISEIIDLFDNLGFMIENDLVLPVEDLPMHEIICKKITINYCALLKKKTDE